MLRSSVGICRPNLFRQHLNKVSKGQTSFTLSNFNIPYILSFNHHFVTSFPQIPVAKLPEAVTLGEEVPDANFQSTITTTSTITPTSVSVSTSTVTNIPNSPSDAETHTITVIPSILTPGPTPNILAGAESVDPSSAPIEVPAPTVQFVVPLPSTYIPPELAPLFPVNPAGQTVDELTAAPANKDEAVAAHHAVHSAVHNAAITATLQSSQSAAPDNALSLTSTTETISEIAVESDAVTKQPEALP